MNVLHYVPLIVALGITAAADARQTSLSSEDTLQVFLDGSGIESRYVNPVKPISLNGRPLQFINKTGDRTFVVTIPLAYSAVELASAYAVANGSRGGQNVSMIVCNALAGSNGQLCGGAEREEIDTEQGLRVLLEAVMAAKPTDLATCDLLLKTPNCLVESLFWTAAPGAGVGTSTRRGSGHLLPCGPPTTGLLPAPQPDVVTARTASADLGLDNRLLTRSEN